MFPLGALAVVLGKPQHPLLLVAPHVVECLSHMSLAELDPVCFQLVHGVLAEVELRCCLRQLYLLQPLGQS